jgi:hypothetical protein
MKAAWNPINFEKDVKNFVQTAKEKVKEFIL